MGNNDININKIKVAIFDFDDTLAIHKDKNYLQHRKESEDKRLGYFLNAYKNVDTFYENIEECAKSEVLYKLINDLRNRGVKLYCLSAMKYSFHLKAKQSFINKHYGEDIEVLTVASQELKLDGVKIIQKINDCNLNEILFIDDRKDVIELLNKNGVNGIIVDEVQY